MCYLGVINDNDKSLMIKIEHSFFKAYEAFCSSCHNFLRISTYPHNHIYIGKISVNLCDVIK